LSCKLSKSKVDFITSFLTGNTIAIAIPITLPIIIAKNDAVT
jgi:hypothetical protein